MNGFGYGFPDAPWTTEAGYDRYRNAFYGLEDSDEMTFRLWDYDEDRCSGHECYCDCEYCEYNSDHYEGEDLDE